MSQMSIYLGSAIAVIPAVVVQPLMLAQLPPQLESTDNPSSTRAVSLALPDVIQRVVQANRDLKNAGLDRIVQRQELKEAESVFNPRFTPLISVGLAHSQFAGFSLPASTSEVPISRSSGTLTPNLSSINSSRTDPLNDQTNFSSAAQMQAQLTTRMGTRFLLTGDPLASFPLNFTISQPLLRGFGKTVNEAPVKVARLTNTKGELALRQTLIDKITETINAYRVLYQQQETVRIQEASLANRRYQLQVTTALVKAGRKARADLVDIEQSLAEGERQLIDARNRLILANSVLLRLMDTPDTFLIRVTPENIETLIKAAIARAQSLDPTLLLDTAYRSRPDYLRAKLDIETEQLSLITAQDNKRWSLDLQSSTNLGTNAQTSAGLVLTREFGNQRLETEVQRRQVEIRKNTNRFNQLASTIKTELEDQLQTINAAQRQEAAAQQSSQLAKQQLAIAQERFKRGKTTIFEVTQKEDTLTNALNSELNTRLEFWNAIVQLDRLLGTTLETWNLSIQNIESQ